ncbi:MAG TPA: molybdenum cofactor sulfurase, partial [Rhizobiales bacterium]|nr:molybdenum cofactor sulfurase [Hyphomicrobiales bacterium]
MSGASAGFETEIVPARKLLAVVDAVLIATGNDFVTRAVEAIDLGFDGIAGDFHAGLTRRSGGREPWYPRGTEIRNERQLSIVAADELAQIAAGMGIAGIAPE